MRTITRLLRFALALALGLQLSSGLGAQAVWVVDDTPGPGVHFTTLQAAIDAAASADVILVKSGSYPTGFTIQGKSLVIAADAGATVDFAGYQELAISNLASWHAVVLRGIRPPSGKLHAVLTNNAGPVWFEDCLLTGQFTLTPMIPGLTATNCASVVLANCDVSGITNFGYPASHALDGLDSHVIAYDTSFIGGQGFNAPFVDFGCVNGQPGGDGLHMVRGSLFAARCGFMGGNGGSEYQPPSPCNPGAGGDAVDLTDTTPAELYSCNFAVGQPGAGSPVPPPALKIKSNVPVSNVVWPKRMYQVSSPVREQQMIHLTFDLDVATDVYLLAAPEPGLPFTFGGVLGPSTIDLFAMGFVSLGTLPAGQTVFSIPSGDMPPTLMGAYLSTQPMYTNATLTYVELGNPSHLLLLDASF